MLDEQKWIGAQAIMKSLIESGGSKKENINNLPETFKFCMDIIENYSILPEGDELINTGIEIPKQFWNLPTNAAKSEWLTEWGRTQKVEGKGWYVFCKRADLPKLKSVFDKRESEFEDMLNVQSKTK